MLHFSYFVHKLQFAFDAQTSRGKIKEHKVHIIEVCDTNKPKVIGTGEASPLLGLSIDAVDDFELKLQQIIQQLNDAVAYKNIDLSSFPSIEFAIETALADLHFGGIKKIFENDFIVGKNIPINGLIWMADKEKMLLDADEKIAKGFNCIKLKVGNLDFDEECRLLEQIRKKHSAFKVEIRLDANGAFLPEDALLKLKEFARFEIHSIEQPIEPKQFDFMQEICAQSKIKIALDEELIGIAIEKDGNKIIRYIKPHFLILKPTLVGGFTKCNQWIEIATKNNIEWWLTSALESNIGLNAIAQFASNLGVKNHQGLGTGSLYSNNFESPLLVDSGFLKYLAS